MDHFAVRWKLSFLGLMCILLSLQVSSNVRFTKIECWCTDKKICEFAYCYLKAINRTYRYITLRTRIYQFPVDNVTINVDVVKRANGWRPFLYNVTLDGCKFLRERKNPLINYFYSFIKEHSNFNHRCPYNHDVYVEKLSDSSIEKTLTNLPVPPGDYGVKTSWYVRKELHAVINVYAQYY